jgi:hypothetical protein
MILLSMLIPISLLATLRMVGIVPEPLGIRVEGIKYSMNRPSNTKDVDVWTNNSYTDSGSSIDFSVLIKYYIENHQERGDHIELKMLLEANTDYGFIRSVLLRLSRGDTQAYLDIMEDTDWIILQNLSIEKILDQRESNEAYVEAISPNRSKQALLAMFVFWMFVDENDVNHWAAITAEVTYFNGRTQQEVILPINVEVLVG